MDRDVDRWVKGQMSGRRWEARAVGSSEAQRWKNCSDLQEIRFLRNTNSQQQMNPVLLRPETET